MDLISILVGMGLGIVGAILVQSIADNIARGDRSRDAADFARGRLGK